MNNIDFSRLVTSQAKAAQAVAAHRVVAKAECRRRILMQFSLEAQQNIAQVIALHAAEALQGQSFAENAFSGGLSEADIAQAAKAQGWIAAMQAACRALSDDQGSDPLVDDAWPDLPAGVARLIARF